MIYLWVFVFLMIYMYVYHSGNGRKLDRMFPGPFRVPILGNVLLVITSLEGINKLIVDLPKKYNYKTFRFWFLYKPYISVPDYKVAKMVLSSPSFVDKPREYRFFEPWLGQNFIFTGPEEPWKRCRKVVTPAFHFNIVKQYFGVFYENAEIFSKLLEKHEGKGAFDLYEYILLYALDNVGDTVMGLDMQSQKNPESSYVQALKGVAKVIFYRLLWPWLRSDVIFKMSSLNDLQEKSLKVLHGFSNKVIQERKKQLEQIAVHQDSETERYLKQKKALLDSLLENSKAVGFTDQEIRQIVDFITFAGHDTVAASLGFLFYALAEYQDVQEKVYQELERIFQKSDRCPTYDDLQEMKYSEQVIKETLRLYPVVPAIARKSRDDLYINEKQYIPANSFIAILLCAIHRDPEIYPDPDKFDPERFSPEASRNRDPYTFLPFSAGPRNCLGIKFAMYEMKITLYSILRKYKISLSDNPEDKMKIRPNFIMTSSNGIRIKVESRNTQRKFLNHG